MITCYSTRRKLIIQWVISRGREKKRKLFFSCRHMGAGFFRQGPVQWLWELANSSSVPRQAASWVGHGLHTLDHFPWHRDIADVIKVTNQLILFFEVCVYLSVLDLHCCVGLFPSWSEGRLLSSCTAWVSHCGDSRCRALALGAQFSVAVAHRFWGTGSTGLWVIWDLRGSGIEPGSPVLTGRVFTAEPPGKPKWVDF